MHAIALYNQSNTNARANSDVRQSSNAATTLERIAQKRSDLDLPISMSTVMDFANSCCIDIGIKANGHARKGSLYGANLAIARITLVARSFRCTHNVCILPTRLRC
jgi:hypothetical protein